MAYTINDTFYQQILNGTQNSSLFEILNDEGEKFKATEIA